MPNVIEICDLSRPELDVFARLTEAQLRCRRMPEKGLFIAESVKVISHALDAGYEPVSLLMERRQIVGQAGKSLTAAAEFRCTPPMAICWQELTGYHLTRGVLCAMRRPRLREPEEVCAGAQRVAVLEQIADPTNVGRDFPLCGGVAYGCGVGSALLL